MKDSRLTSLNQNSIISLGTDAPAVRARRFISAGSASAANSSRTCSFGNAMKWNLSACRSHSSYFSRIEMMKELVDIVLFPASSSSAASSATGRRMVRSLVL